MGEQPGFFKFFIPEKSWQRMQIPPAFVHDYLRGQRIKKETFIKDVQGNVWPMKISIEGKAAYFDEGWAQFVEDNRIGLGEFLAFEFRSDHGFDFKHFGISACEKEKTGSFRFTVKQEVLELGEEEEEVAMNNAYNGAEEDDYDEEDNTDDGVEEGEGDETGEDDEEFEVGDEADEDEDDGMLKVNGRNDEGEKKNKRKSANGSKKKYTLRYPRLLKAEIIEYEEEIFGSGVVPRPRNPYFVVKNRPGRRQELFIPNDVVRDHGLNLPTEIYIVDENGKRWHSVIKVWSSGRIALKKGWKALRKWNHLKIDDKCLFEFVRDRKNKRQLCLQVRIFRA